MISFTLKCEDGHSFDSWFQSAAAFDALAKSGHLNCAVCGSSKVSKSLMAPRVSAKSSDGTGHEESDDKAPALSAPQSDAEKAVTALRKNVEQNSDYVGSDFVTQARAMHQGDVPERSIYGEARLDQAKALFDEGVPVIPLPFRPKQKLS